MPPAVAGLTPPGLRRLRGYRREWLPGDLTAGLIVAALAVPQALGYAVVAGVPVQVGLYTIPPALLAYAVLGTSPVLFVGPVSTVTVLSGAVVRGLSGGDPAYAVALTSALSIVAGLVLIAVGTVRVGWVAQFLSEPIVTGFVTGLVVLVVVGEIPGLLGLTAPGGALLDRVLAIALSLPRAQPATVLVAAAALVLLFGGSRVLPRLPWSLVALVAGIVGSHLLDLAGSGVAVVGAVPSGLPIPSLPLVPVEAIPALVTGGLAVAAVGIAEGLAAANTFGSPDQRLDDDAEFVANGAADIAAGLFGGMGVAGSLSKTAANVRAGAHTQASGLVGAVVVLGVLLFAAGLLAALPTAVLAAIVIHAVWSLVKPARFRHFRRIRRNDFVGSIVALVGVLVAGPLNGLLIAIGQSLLGLVYRSMQVHIDEMGKVPGEKAAWGALASDPLRTTVKRVCVLRLDGPLFWANANSVVDRIEHVTLARPGVRALVIDLEATTQLDTTTSERIRQLVHTLRGHAIEVFFVRVHGRVRGVLERSGVAELTGPDRMWRSISAGVKAAKADVHARRRIEAYDPDEFNPYEEAAEDLLLAEEGDERIVTRSVDERDPETAGPPQPSQGPQQPAPERPVPPDQPVHPAAR